MNLSRKAPFFEFFINAFVLCSGLVLAGCVSVAPVYYADDKKAVPKKVDEFHQSYNDKKFKEMYKMMSPETQKVLSEEQFVQRFEQVYNESGKTIKSTPLNSGVKPQAASRLVTFIYETEFQNGKVEEKFVCSTDGKQAVIEIYDQPNKTSSNASQ